MPVSSKTAHYPGVPAVVSPAEAEWLSRNHPQYDAYKDVIEARVAVWREANDPDFKVGSKKADVERHALLRAVAAGTEPPSVLYPAETDKKKPEAEVAVDEAPAPKSTPIGTLPERGIPAVSPEVAAETEATKSEASGAKADNKAATGGEAGGGSK